MGKMESSMILWRWLGGNVANEECGAAFGLPFWVLGVGGWWVVGGGYVCRV